MPVQRWSEGCAYLYPTTIRTSATGMILRHGMLLFAGAETFMGISNQKVKSQVEEGIAKCESWLPSRALRTLFELLDRKFARLSRQGLERALPAVFLANSTRGCVDFPGRKEIA